MHALVVDNNELQIAQQGGLAPILQGAQAPQPELQSQSARALRNLSVNAENKQMIRKMGGVEILQKLTAVNNERIQSQARRALKNLEVAAAAK